MFSTHPPTGDRIESTKKNIEAVLPDREEYVVTTSEFTKIRTLLAQLENRTPNQEEANKPSLKRKTSKPDTDSDDPDLKNDKKNPKETKPEDREPARRAVRFAHACLPSFGQIREDRGRKNASGKT